MAIDVSSFLDSLAAWMVARALAQTPSLVLTVPGDLWLYEAKEDDVGAGDDGRKKVYSVLIPSAHVVPYVPVAEISVQVATRGFGNAAVMARASALANTLLDADGRPLRMTSIPAATPAYRINGITDLRGPSAIGRDDQGRLEAVFNFDARIVKL